MLGELCRSESAQDSRSIALDPARTSALGLTAHSLAVALLERPYVLVQRLNLGERDNGKHHCHEREESCHLRNLLFLQRLTLELSGHINREAIDWSA